MEVGSINNRNLADDNYEGTGDVEELTDNVEELTDEAEVDENVSNVIDDNDSEPSNSGVSSSNHQELADTEEYKAIDNQLLESRLIESNEELPRPRRSKVKPKPKTATRSKKKTTSDKKNKQPLVKKGPGRPRKSPKKEPMPRRGVSSIATDSGNYIEFLYDNPVYIHKLLGIFKSLAAAQVQMIFRPTEIIMYAQDHHDKTKIRVRIDASKVNHYYCRNTLDIGVSEKDLEVIMNKVDNGYSSIILVSTNDNTQKNITLVLDNDIQINESHTIDLVGRYNRMENEAEFIDENYMIKFALPGKYFRKTINDIKTMSHQLSIIQEDNDSKLVFEYFTMNKKIHSRHTVSDSNKIKLISNLADGAMFRVDIKVDYIKPISSSHIADEIMIFVDENKKFMTKAYIDGGTIEIKTITEIIDQRPADDED